MIVCVCVCVLVTQSCPALCDPMDCSPPGSSVHKIFQARILEWVTISFSKGSSQPRDRTRVSCTAGRFFTNWATREAPWDDGHFINKINLLNDTELFNNTVNYQTRMCRQCELFLNTVLFLRPHTAALQPWKKEPFWGDPCVKWFSEGTLPAESLRARSWVEGAWGTLSS